MKLLAAVKRVAAAIELTDVLSLAGFIAVVYGVSRVYVPAAWVVAGVLLLRYAYLVEAGREGARRRAATESIERGALRG